MQTVEVKLNLNQKEIEILRLLSTGLQFKEVAAKMNVKKWGVEACVERMREKYDVLTTIQLVYLAAKQNLI